MKPGPFSKKNMVLLLLIPCFLQWNNVAVSASDSQTLSPAPLDLPFPLMHGDAFVYPWLPPEETPVITDFDNDSKADVAQGRWIGNEYGITILLSSRSGITSLSSSVRTAGFTLLACDINQDSFQDIVVVSPIAKHPLAVWLGDGKGGFAAANPDCFNNDFGFTATPRFVNGTFPSQQNPLIEPSHLFCEKPILIFADFGLQRNGFVTCESAIYPLRHDRFPLKPRSPPISFPF